MAKTINDSVLDGAFDVLDQADLMTVCSAQPTTYTEAITTYKLADVAVVPDTDFTKADDVSGRKVTVAAKATVPIDASGTATHIALVKSSGSVLIAVTTCTSQALVSGGTVDFPEWKVNIQDPT